MTGGTDVATVSYDLQSWAAESRDVLDTLVRRRGIEPRWYDDHITVAAEERAQVDDLVAYLNGSASPGVTATQPWLAAPGIQPGPPPAWHPNPEDAATWRWWDGNRWTSFTEPTPAPVRPWFPPRAVASADRVGRTEGGLRGGGLIALVGFVVAEALSVGLVLLALELGASKRSVLVLALSGVALWSGLLGACVLAVRRHGSGSLRDLGLVRLRWSDLGTGVVASIVARVAGAAVAIVLIALLPDESYGEGTSLLDQSRPSVLAMVVVFMFVVVGAPFFEELFFRGLVQGALVGRVGARAAVVIQALMFATVHYQIGMPAASFAITFAVISIAGLTLGMLRWHTGRLGPGMLAHAAFNLVAVVVTFLTL